MATPANDRSSAIPSKAVILLRGLTLRCPRCGKGGLFHHWTEMSESCPRCGLVFSQEEGYWTGALVVNTMVSLVLFAVLIGIVVIATWPDIPVFTTIAVGVVAAIAFPYVFYPISKTVWVAIDLAYFHPELLRPGTGLRGNR
jgi:uncharacterized protein (DUF983 family)